jgi:hypothetical protein
MSVDTCPSCGLQVDTDEHDCSELEELPEKQYGELA